MTKKEQVTIRFEFDRSMAPSPLPLPTTFFESRSLHADDAKACISLGEQTSVEVIRHSQLEGGPIQWSFDSEDSNVQVYSGVDPTAPCRVQTFCAVSLVRGSIDDVATLFHAGTTEECREQAQRFAYSSVDAALLHTLAMPSQATPRHTTAIKWLALNILPASKTRDCVYVESTHDFERHGRRGWVRSLKSIKISTCPDLKHNFQLVRCSIHRAGLVCLETDVPGVLHITQLMQVNLESKFPTVVQATALRRFVRHLGLLQTALWESKLALHPLLPDHKLVPHSTRGHCYICQRKFNSVVFQTKQSCRLCGQVVCANCSKEWNTLVRGGSPTALRACCACMKHTVVDVSQAVIPTPTTPAQDVQNPLRHIHGAQRERPHDQDVRQCQRGIQQNHKMAAKTLYDYAPP
ncbi:unnamed protein product [Aphanomyces euteiches]